MSNEWRICKRWKPGRALSVLRGKLCICSHCTAIFSLNGNIKTAQVNPILCRWGSFQHHKRNMDCTSNQCLDQGLWGTCFSINMYVLILTPVHLSSWPNFFPTYSRTVFCFFLFFLPALPEATFFAKLQRAYTAYTVLFSLPVQQRMPTPLHHSSLSSLSRPAISVHLLLSFFSSRALFQSPTFNWLFLLLILPFILTFTFSFSFPH